MAVEMTRNAEISVIRKETYDYAFFFDQQKKTGLEHRLSSLESSTGSINANFRNRRFTAILLFYDFLTLFFRSQGHIRPVYNLQRPFRYLYIFGALLNTEKCLKIDSTHSPGKGRSNSDQFELNKVRKTLKQSFQI